MKKIISFFSCLFVFSCFVFAGDEVVHSYFYHGSGQSSSFSSEGDYPVVIDPDFPVVLDPNWPGTLAPDFPDTEEPEFPEAEVKPVKDVLKEEAENAMREAKEHFKVALEKLMKQNLFDFDSDVIKDENFANLDAIAEFLKEYDNINVKVEGHTDNIGTEEYNKNLSERRAKAVGDYLINKGIDSNRVKTEGFGFTKPVADNDTEEGQAQNRRTEMVFELQDKSNVVDSSSQSVQEKAVREVLEEEVEKTIEEKQEEIETVIKQDEQTLKQKVEPVIEEKKEEAENVIKEEQSLKKEAEVVIEEKKQKVKEEVETKEEELSSDLERALKQGTPVIEETKEEVSNVEQEIKEEVETKEEELSDLERALKKNVEAGKEDVSNVEQEVKEEVETKEEELSDLERALKKNVEAGKEEVSNVEQEVKEEVETKEEELSDLERALKKDCESAVEEEELNLQQALRKETEKAMKEEKEDFKIALDKFSQESLFEFGSAMIMEENFANLDAIAEFLKENNNIAVKIEGHTDNIGSEEYNKDLSERRAKSVGNYLIEKGVDKNRVTTEGFGMSRPIASNDTEEGQEQNRRTEIIFKIQK